MTTTLRTKMMLAKSRIVFQDVKTWLLTIGFAASVWTIAGLIAGFSTWFVLAIVFLFIIYTFDNLYAQPLKRYAQEVREARIRDEAAKFITEQYNRALADVGAGFELEFEVNPDNPDRFILSLYRLDA